MKSVVTKKPSGHAFRKARQVRAMKGELVKFRIKMTPNCVEDYRAIIGRVTRAFANGEIPLWFSNQMAYLCQVGINASKETEKLEVLREMSKLLEQSTGKPLPPNGMAVFESSGLIEHGADES